MATKRRRQRHPRKSGTWERLDGAPKRRTRRPSKVRGLLTWKRPSSIVKRADRALIARLEKRGALTSGPDAGKPLDPDDELLQPGPPCPGAVDALIAERREGP